jgi:hypothetical protein
MTTSLPWRRWFGKQTHRLLALSMLAALAGYSGATHAAEDPKCLSPNPADWPPPARPFFMIAFDTSGSMVACTNNAFIDGNSGSLAKCQLNTPASAFNSCGLVPNRINDGKCAVRKMVQAFGEVDFGLSTFPSENVCTGPAAACGPYTGVDSLGPTESSGPGNRCLLRTKTNPDAITCPGVGQPTGKTLVGLPVAANQVAQIVELTDDICNNGDPKELLPVGGTPLNGLLVHSASYIKANIAQLQPSCRPINIILITDGEESCEASTKARDTARELYQNITANGGAGVGRSVRVFPVGFGQLSDTGVQALEQIADAGQCNDNDAACQAKAKALFANNEAELSIALSKIITGSIQPETCDNVDNNCNGCTDEGFQHFCNRGRTPVGNPLNSTQCCSWTNVNNRKLCLDKYALSGNTKDLPCWDPASPVGSVQPEQSWLCVDPGEICDDKDNNCDVSPEVGKLNTNTIDEFQKKCGAPLKCALPQDTCTPGTIGVDDDCDGIVDNAPNSSTPGSACPNNCVPSTEVCNGKDDNCDGLTDNNVPEIPCGAPAGPGTAPNCQGTLKCINGSYSKICNVTPQEETCDGLDNDCDGLIDDGAPGVPCVPDPQLKYQEDGFPLSQCKKGIRPCGAAPGVCGNFVGPSQEICDGIDNDCDGEVDEGNLPGVGAPCGKNQGACTPGLRACVNGVFVCQGGVQPQPELCNGLDDDCDGIPDTQETVFDDAPPADQNGCWTGIKSCDAQDLCKNPANGPDWCKPAGAECGGLGTLQAPCVTGKLSCQNNNGTFAYLCKGGLVPSPEKCDGADNDCDGTADEDLQIEPKPCETACGQGFEECKDGKISCSSPTPKPEACNNLDDDCNGKVDDGVVRACSTECGSGVEVCTAGAFGPCSAPPKGDEVCDGLDNDCDGLIDENADLDGTKDPLDENKIIGAICDWDPTKNKGECRPGVYKCIGGLVKCVGSVTPQKEVCDGKDNDCDGVNDNETEADPLCDKLANQACVKTGDAAQCALPCSPGEFPCPAGNYTCLATTTSGSSPTDGQFCVQPSGCQDCAAQTVKQVINGKEQILCAPSFEPGSTPVPVCVCRNNTCSPPCAGVFCDSPLVCTDFTTTPGSCVDNSCFTVPCANGQVCNPAGQCVENPCKPSTCQPGEVCKPSSDLQTSTCTPSCAGVTCKEGEACVDGACKATQCPPEGCGAGKICDKAQGACVDATCKGCKVGQTCSPTGECVADPCEGVLCPAGQRCDDGECFTASGAAGSAGASGAAGASGSSTAGSGTSGAAGSGAGTGGTGVAGSSTNGAGGGVSAVTKPIGLTTGGGGCTCSTGVGAPTGALGSLSLLLAALPALRRRARSAGKKAAQ